jgi:hypothetical protein
MIPQIFKSNTLKFNDFSAALGCCEAPLKNGSHKTTLQTNGNHHADHHQMH